MSLYKKSATELSAMLSSKEISAVELCNDVFKRISQTEGSVNAYLSLCEESALETAKGIDTRRAAGENLPPLAGIPVGIKDNLCVKGTKTTCASKILHNFEAPYDATVVAKLKANGAVITGKLNLDEFAMGSTCENSAFGKTHNPRDLTRSPGGSSGGSAAAVAAGSAVVSLGSDTGGSIREPASWCGLVGLKPTYGSVSRYGLVAFASSLDQVGPFGRTVSDVAMTYSAICGADKFDATSVNCTYPDFTKSLTKGVAGLTIGIPAEYFGEGVNPEVHQSVMTAVAALKAEGAVVKEISLPSTPAALAAYYIISSAEASSNLSRFDGIKYGHRSENFTDLVDLYEASRSEGFGDEVKRRIMLGTFVLSSGFFDAYYKRAKKLQQKISDEFSQAFSGCDVIITPTSPFTALKLGENCDNPVADYASDVCTVTVNIAGLPAISIPCGTTKEGLPVGMQIIAPKFGEETLFAISAHYEKLCGGFMGVAEIK